MSDNRIVKTTSFYVGKEIQPMILDLLNKTSMSQSRIFQVCVAIVHEQSKTMSDIDFHSFIMKKYREVFGYK